MNHYTIDKGIIYSENGLPYAPRWFCDGRLAIQMDHDGIGDVHYFGRNSNGFMMLHKCFWGGIRFHSTDEEGRRMIRPEKCTIMPFGFQSDGEKCVFSVYVAGNTVYILLTPKKDMDFGMEFNTQYLFYPDTSEHADVGLNGNSREWAPLVFEDNTLYTSYKSNEKEVYVAFSSNAVLSHKTRTLHGKNILSADGLKADKEYTFTLHFSDGERSVPQNGKDAIAAQFARYEAVAAKAPVLKSPREKLNAFFSLAPMYHESVKVTEEKGAIRAKTNHYWVWGWDSLTSNECSFYWGDQVFMGDMLDFILKNSDENGIANAFSYDLNNSGCSTSLPNEGMYTCLVDAYRLSGGDITAYYPAVKSIFEKILSMEVSQTGLCAGISLYPDYPTLAHETEHNNISTFNNTVVYCCAKSTEKLAAFMKDTETEAKAKAFCERTEAHFEKILFHENMGFVDCAADATTFELRGVASNNSVKWENNYCDKLFSDRMKASCLDFYEKHLVCKAGIRPYPEWCDSFDADSNQFHSWWPVMTEFYARLINQLDRPDLIAQYVGWIEYWTEKLVCPEGIDCYYNEKEVPFNNWDAMPGIWHAYSIRGFYNAVVHAYIGVSMDENGLNIYPYSGEEVAIQNLHWGEKTIDVSVKGSGKNILSVKLNGEEQGCVKTIPHEALKEQNTIEIIRG